MRISVFFGILFLSLVFAGSLRASQSKRDTLVLENDRLVVKIAKKGAEIISIYNKKAHFEHIWHGEKDSWNSHAPVLFPIVGKLKGGTYTVDGKTYKMPNHGFTHKKNFVVQSNSLHEARLVLQDDAESLKMYPYHFKLIADYRLAGNKLYIHYTVENTDSRKMFFSIGAHPGFNVPFLKDEVFSDYYLKFEKKEVADRIPLTRKKGLVNLGGITRFLNNTDTLRLNHAIFRDRVIILEGLKSEYVNIQSDRSPFAVRVAIKGFPFVGVWTTSRKDAPFVCIEPWFGISDVFDSNGDFKHKKGIRSLEPQKAFDMNYSIEIVSRENL